MSASRPNTPITFDEVTSYEPPAEIAVHARARVGAVLIVLLGLIAHAPSLVAGWLPQDGPTVVDNPAMKSWKGLWFLIAHPGTQSFFSPLGMATLHAQYQFTTKPITFHLIAVAMHVVTALLFWTLLRKLELPGALAAAAIFAAHPIHTEAVNWISQRPTLSSALLLTVLAIVYFRRIGLNPLPAERWGMWNLPESNRALYVWSIVLFLLAVAAHPVAAVFPLFAVLMIWWEHNRITRGDWKLLAPFIVVTWIVLGGAAWIAMRTHDTTGDPTVVQRLLIFGRAFWFYLAKLFAPVGMMFAYPRWELDPAPATAWLWLAATAAAIALPWVLHRRIGRGAAAAVTLYAAMLLPMCLTFSSANQRDSFVANHAAYLPTMPIIAGVCALLAERLAKASAALRGVGIGLATAVAITLGVGTFLYADEFRDPATLWQRTVDRNPDAVPAYLQLGQLQLNKRQLDQAERSYFSVLRLQPRNVQALLKLGEVYEHREPPQMDRAIAQYETAALGAVDKFDVYFHLAGALDAQKRSVEAIAYYERCTLLRPKDPVPFNNIGKLRADRGETDLALAEYKKALDLDPHFVPAYSNRAAIFAGRGDYQAAEAEIMEANKYDPNNPVILANAATICANLGLTQRAEQLYSAAVHFDPTRALYWTFLGQVQLRQAKYAEAVFAFNRASQLEPNNADLRNNLDIAKRLQERDLAKQQGK